MHGTALRQQRLRTQAHAAETKDGTPVIFQLHHQSWNTIISHQSWTFDGSCGR